MRQIFILAMTFLIIIGGAYLLGLFSDHMLLAIIASTLVIAIINEVSKNSDKLK